MARTRGKPTRSPKKEAKPSAGDVYAVPLPEGNWGACRVLRVEARYGTLLAACDWMGPAMPALDEPRLRSILRTDREQCAIWAGDDGPPEGLVLRGSLALSAADRRINPLVHSGWGYVTATLTECWRRRYDPEYRRALEEQAAQVQRERPIVAKHRRLQRKLGSTFAVPLEDGRFGACRIVRVDAEGQKSLFAATEYLDAQPPELADPRLRTILIANTTIAAVAFGPCLRWQYWIEPPPATFQHLGTIEPDPRETKANPSNFSKTWEGWPAGILMEWRWRNDRPALAAAFDKLHGAGAFERLANAKKPTLRQLRPAKFFANWKGDVAAPAIRDSRKLLVELVEGLMALGKKPTKKLARPLVKKCIVGFNRLDETHSFIATIEREDILDTVFEVLDAAGLQDCEAWGEEWRDW